MRKFNACAHLKYCMATIVSCAAYEMNTTHESIIYDLIFKILTFPYYSTGRYGQRSSLGSHKWEIENSIVMIQSFQWSTVDIKLSIWQYEDLLTVAHLAWTCARPFVTHCFQVMPTEDSHPTIDNHLNPQSWIRLFLGSERSAPSWRSGGSLRVWGGNQDVRGEADFGCWMSKVFENTRQSRSLR
jgi:hypothetical protein